MLTIRGKGHRLCNGVSRRDALKIGTLGVAGLTLPNLLQLQAEAAPTNGKATSIIMIHLSGGPSHVDTYDMKPDAPAEIRGEFKAIPTKLDGMQVCELFPLQAKIMNRLAIVRSISKVVPEEHDSSLMTTGYSFTERRASGDRPSIGSVLAKLRSQPESELPSYVSLRGVNQESGLNAAYLGPTCEPLVYDGPGREDLHLTMKPARLDQRRKLLDQVNSFRTAVDSGAIQSQNVFAQRALEIVASSTTYKALDVSGESDAIKKQYGKDNEHFLRARRLVESGVQCVALEVGGWDTHSDNFPQLKRIMPPLDQAFSALMNDLHDRGLDEKTVVVMWGEFGRTPKINGSAGRDHWPSVMSAVIAGGGLKVGQVIGATDAMGMNAVEGEMHVRSVVATLYHALGIDPKMTFIDQQQRPVPLIHDADPIAQLIG